ncbi:hypothetical protein [Primorskyibacter sp. 2E233]|uniref:hypothetical protein n=1 Tax=Primorskyibacter sp. 2E233 TaxID=3413431 RepID=UPI003BF24096
MARVFGNVIPSTMNFAHETVHPRETLDVPRFAADDSALLDGFGIEQVAQPNVWRQGRITVLHQDTLQRRY